MDQDWYDCDVIGVEPHEAFDWEYEAYLEARQRIHYVDDIPITGKDYPLCLGQRTFECDLCSFFFEGRLENECRLLRAKAERTAIWDAIRPWVAMEQRRDALRKALETELRTHGRELHYTVLVRIIRERYPNLRSVATEYTVSRTLCSFPNTFERLVPGLYRLAPGAAHSRGS
jgi:hypothetical protein